jgi:hypothetical protein
MRSAVRLWWPSVVFPTVILIAFYPLWWSGEVLAFRDSLHFFYPLWSYVDSLQGTEGCLPFWNPWDGLGNSVVAEPTSMIFYPPRWGLLLRFGTIENRIGWFLVGHLVFTYFGWIYCGSQLRWHPLSNQLGAWGYTLSGPVFFQIYNPPYLVGAAWLPLAMLACWQVLAQETPATYPVSFKKVAGLAFPLAMLVLGGDAQTAYHVVMLGGVFLLTAMAFNSIRPMLSSNVPSGKIRQAFCSMMLLVAASGLALGLSAVQIAPTWNWLKHSSRIDGAEPSRFSRRLSMPPSARATTDQRTTRLETPTVGEKVSLETSSGKMRWKGEERLQFATQPWHLLTMILPNCFGSFTPIHTRWSQLLPSDGRVWVPSLHVGTSIFLLFLLTICSGGLGKRWAAERIDGARFRFRVMTFSATIAVIALLSSFDFGLYRIWSAFMPLYEAFRYPAKWTTFFVWGICASVSSISVQYSPFEPTIGKRWLAWTHRTIAVVGALVLLFHLSIVYIPSVTEYCYARLQSLPMDRWCGSIDLQTTVRNLGFSGLALLGMGLVVSFASRQSSRCDCFGLLQTLLFVSVWQLWFAGVSQLCFEKPEKLKAAVAASVQKFEQKDNECLVPWRFGNWTCCVVKELCNADNLGQPSSLAEKQAYAMLGKFHLLDLPAEFPIRNLQADFTLTPRILGLAKRENPFELWEHSAYSMTGVTLDETHVQFRDVFWDGARIKFTSRSDREYLLDLPVFDDGGWSIRPSSSTKVNAVGKRLTVQIHQGDQTVQLRYETPLLKLGFAITFSSVLLVLICSGLVAFSSHSAARMLVT